MKKLNLEVIRTDRYAILIDEKVWNKASLENWSNVFNYVDSVDELAKNLAYKITNQGILNQFYEGFGYVELYEPNGQLMKQYVLRNGTCEEVKEFCKGIQVIVVDFDEDFDYEVEEIKQLKGSKVLICGNCNCLHGCLKDELS